MAPLWTLYAYLLITCALAIKLPGPCPKSNYTQLPFDGKKADFRTTFLLSVPFTGRKSLLFPENIGTLNPKPYVVMDLTPGQEYISFAQNKWFVKWSSLNHTVDKQKLTLRSTLHIKNCNNDRDFEQFNSWVSNYLWFIWACEDLETGEHDEALLVNAYFDFWTHDGKVDVDEAALQKLVEILPKSFGEDFAKAVDWTGMTPQWQLEDKSPELLIPCPFTVSRKPILSNLMVFCIAFVVISIVALFFCRGS